MARVISPDFGLGLANKVEGGFEWIYENLVEPFKSGFRPWIQIPAAILAFILSIFVFIGWVLALLVDIVVEFVEWLAGAAVAVVEWVEGVFNDTDDDIARERIADMSCDEINALSNEELFGMTESLLSAGTGSEDEHALIKIVECLNCNRLAGTYWPRFGTQILSDTDNEEFDRLRVALRRCGIMNFSDWDDDATRVFIDGAACAELRALSMDDIEQLLTNLFEGDDIFDGTGDDDERSIIKLIECLDRDTVQTLVGRSGFSVEDFDDHVDGSEWTRLVAVFRSKGVPAEE